MRVCFIQFCVSSICLAQFEAHSMSSIMNELMNRSPDLWSLLHSIHLIVIWFNFFKVQIFITKQSLSGWKTFFCLLTAYKMKSKLGKAHQTIWSQPAFQASFSILQHTLQPPTKSHCSFSHLSAWHRIVCLHRVSVYLFSMWSVSSFVTVLKCRFYEDLPIPPNLHAPLDVGYSSLI